MFYIYVYSRLTHYTPLHLFFHLSRLIIRRNETDCQRGLVNTQPTRTFALSGLVFKFYRKVYG
jgi:hypothetical protein